MTPMQITSKSMEMHLPNQTICREDLNIAGIRNDRVPTYNRAEPLMLIGLDNIRVTTPLESTQVDNIIVSRTPLDWTMEGTITQGTRKRKAQTINSIQLVDLRNLIEQFIDNENLGIDPKRPVLEPEETRQAGDQLARGIKKIRLGYEVPLLWKSSKRPGPRNRAYAMKRFISFERKMRQDPRLRTQANNIIKRYEDRNYITLANPATSDLAWYLPIFATNTSSKTRLVWDGAGHYNRSSLNGLLLKGPDLNEPL